MCHARRCSREPDHRLRRQPRSSTWLENHFLANRTSPWRAGSPSGPGLLDRKGIRPVSAPLAHHHQPHRLTTSLVTVTTLILLLSVLSLAQQRPERTIDEI